MSESRGNPGEPGCASLQPVGLWLRWVARVRSWFEIPYGYEDERGFHYGKPPALNRIDQAQLAGNQILTDRATEAMTYSMALPMMTETSTQAAEPAKSSVKIRVPA